MIDRKLEGGRLESSEPIGEVSIPRLYAYHRALAQARETGKMTITSHGLAALLGHTIASTQIRKDLSALGPLGRRGQGYAIDPLVEQLAWVLGLEHDWRIAVQDVSEMERTLPRAGCNIAVISVPAEAAQESAQRVADLGIRAILNFAPMPLHLRGPVIVRNIDLAGEMAILTHRLSLETAE
jgi:redox-sensing transcriptional repressor